jgi:hypothetical protein
MTGLHTARIAFLVLLAIFTIAAAAAARKRT